MSIALVPIAPANRTLANRLIAQRWGSTEMILRGQRYDMTRVDGLFAMDGAEAVGLVTFRRHGDGLEIMSLDSLREGQGIGTALVESAIAHARASGCAQVTLITTNDNLRALGFYQKRGFDLVRLYRGALDVSRAMKPEIPLVGEGGIPLRHELELAYPLENCDHTKGGT